MERAIWFGVRAETDVRKACRRLLRRHSTGQTWSYYATPDLPSGESLHVLAHSARPIDRVRFAVPDVLFQIVPGHWRALSRAVA